MDMKVSSTIGFERAHQELLRLTDEDEFVTETTAALGPQPPNFEDIVALNRGPLVETGVEAAPARPAPGRAARDDGALVVDVRTELQFDEAHIPGAVCMTALPRRLRLQARLARRRGRGGGRARRPRRRGGARSAVTLAGAVGVRSHRRLPRRRHDLLAGGAAPGRPDRADDGARAPRSLGRRGADARRARAVRVGRRPHPRLGLHALPRHPTRSRRGSTPSARSPRSAAPGSAPPWRASLLQRARRARRHPRGRRRRAGAWERQGWPVER